MRSEVKIALVVGLVVIVGAIVWTALDRKTEKQLDLLPENLSGLEHADGNSAMLVSTTDLGRKEPERPERRDPPAQPPPRAVSPRPETTHDEPVTVVPAERPPAPHLPLDGAGTQAPESESGPVVGPPAEVSPRPMDDSGPRPQRDDVALPPRRTETQPAVQPTTQPPPMTYTIRDGDTFIRIARERLGDARLHTRIAEANPQVNPNRLRVGQQIILPPKEGPITQPPVQPATQPAAKPESAPATPPAGSAPGGAATVRTYVVETGDTLSSIARDVLGSDRRWNELFELNRDVLKSPDVVVPGMRLRLPPATPPTRPPQGDARG